MTPTKLTTTTTIAPTNSATRALLGAGVMAGPIFVLTGAVQAATRDGFDLSHQPLSLLSLGELGWIQIANFVLAGLLSLAFAVGVGQVLDGGPASRWAPRLLAVFGVGLIIGGVFVPDPALGYPVGTPDEIPDGLSLHGMLHAVAPPLSFLALVATCFVVARRFSTEHHRVAAAGTRVVAIACLVLSVPVGPGFSWRLFAAVTLGFAWISAFAVYLLRRAGEIGQ